jgi:hypothetical protein
MRVEVNSPSERVAETLPESRPERTADRCTPVRRVECRVLQADHLQYHLFTEPE